MRNFNVTGMTCGHCARAVTKAIKRVDSEALVDVDVPGRKVSVDSAADVESLRQAIEAEGYGAQPIAA